MEIATQNRRQRRFSQCFQDANGNALIYIKDSQVALFAIFKGDF